MSRPINHAKEWKRWRLAHDMSQAMFARALGLSLRTVKGIELGEHEPGFTSRQRFKALKSKHDKEDPCLTPFDTLSR